MSALLVVGGSGMLGRAVCQRAVQRGIPVISLSRRGRPDELAGKAWADSVDWREGSASEIQGSGGRALLGECMAVVSTVGIMFDAGLPDPIRQAYSALKNDSSIHAADQDRSYEFLNRDIHLALAAQALSVPQTRSFIYVSTAKPNVLNSKVPLVQRYFSTKQEAEAALAALPQDELRCVSLRPSVMYDAAHAPSLGPAAVSRVSNLLDRFVFSRLGLNDVPHFLPTPPVPVHTVAECAVEAALNPGITGSLDVEDMDRVAHEVQTAQRSPEAQELANAVLTKMMQ